MMQPVMAWVAMVTGAIAISTGWVAVRSALRLAERAHHRTVALATAVEDWQDWFLSGFSGATMGIRWLSALVAGTLWTLAGGLLIGLGCWLVSRF